MEVLYTALEHLVAKTFPPEVDGGLMMMIHALALECTVVGQYPVQCGTVWYYYTARWYSTVRSVFGSVKTVKMKIGLSLCTECEEGWTNDSLFFFFKGWKGLERERVMLTKEID